jgi:uncharacterized membrane protein YdbT with pleckstrin-like domain
MVVREGNMITSIKPDQKLLTKNWLILFTLTLFILLSGLLLQVLIPLGQKTKPGEVAAIVWPIMAGIVLLLWMISVPLIVLWVKNLKYLVEEDKIVIHQGILSRVQKNIPFRAITDFTLHRSLYDRFLGIGSIRIQTAGQKQTATGYEGNLAGLRDWDTLHQGLRERVRKLHPFAESLGVMEASQLQTTKVILSQILEELKAIRKALEK